MESTGLEIEVRPDEERVDLLVRGEIDLSTAEVLRECLDALDPAWRAVCVDLSDVSFMDSTGISELVVARERLHASGGALTIRTPAPNVRRVLEITGLGPLLEA